MCTSTCFDCPSNYHAFKANPSLEVRGVFLVTSKVLDRVWYKHLLHKTICMAINIMVMKRLIEKFLDSRY